RLLLEEHQREGRIRLAAFYVRRLARLLPALIVVGIATIVIGEIEARGPSSGDDVKAVGLALAYITNWAYVFGARLPLEHTWSLSVEEQFYLIWPVILIGLLACGGMKWARRGALVLITVSAVEMFVRSMHGVEVPA